MKNKLVLLNVILALVLVLSACAPAATPAAAPTTAVVAPTMAPEPTKAPVQPTKAPESTATTAAAAPKATATTATTASTDHVISIKLKAGLKWSDGSPLTTKDLVGTYDILWAQGNAAWTYIKDIVVKDDQTVDFVMKSLSPRAIRLILRSNIVVDYTTYADLMDQASALRKAGADIKGDEVKKYLETLNAFKPKSYLVSGPFIIDPASVTEAQVTLVKNPNGYNADKISIDKLLMYFGETNETVPLVLSGDIDYATHGFTPANITAFQALPNIQIIRGPTGTGPGFWFNQNDKNLAKKEVRQAFAYIIDRAENAQVSLGDSGKPLQFMAGFTDSAVPTYLSQATIDKLNKYPKDWAKAEALLTKAGFKKNGKTWNDADGQPFKVELSVPSDFADWFGSAENAADQLKQFGIDASVRGYQSSERATIQSEGKYQILVDLAIYFNPAHPQTSFNYYLNTPRNNPNTDGKPAGMNWSFSQALPDGTPVKVDELLAKSVEGIDVEVQKPYIEQLALLVNEELPVLGLFERYTNDPINTETVTGWLPMEDKIYLNNQTDNYVTWQLLNGGLTSKRPDKSFTTQYPYVQPPKATYNLFTTDSLPVSMGATYWPLENPPLFWFMWSDASYVPVLAESFEIK